MKIFVSYKQIPKLKGYCDSILKSVERLRELGCDVVIDEDVSEDPEIRWQEWVLPHLESSDRILLVISKPYWDAWNESASQVRSGVYLEAKWIKDNLERLEREERLVTCCARSGDCQHLPEELKGRNCFDLTKSGTVKKMIAGLGLADHSLSHRVVPLPLSSGAASVLASKVEAELKDFRRKLAERTCDYTEERITQVTGRLCERFGATSAWLFLAVPEGNGNTVLRLEERLSQNTSRVALEDAFELCGWETPKEGDRRSVVGFVGGSKKPYIIHENPQKDEFYRPCQSNTQSEIAVPILCPGVDGEERLIGVFNLESNQRRKFRDVQKGDLQAAVTELTPHLIVLQALGDRRELGLGGADPIVWHPDEHEWDLSVILGQYCSLVCRAIGEGPGGDVEADGKASAGENGRTPGPRPSCTIWYSDPDTRELCVRGTTRFDYEYIDSLLLSSGSFTGRVVKDLKQGEVVEGNPLEIDSFQRKEKAEEMGMIRLFASPIWREGEQPGGIGSVNLYFFSEDVKYLARDCAKGEVAETLRRVAGDAGRLICRLIEIRRQCAVAYCHHRVAAEALPGINDPAVLLQAINRILVADGGSLFCRRPGKDVKGHQHLGEKTVLQCVATTGLLLHNGNRIPQERAVYRLDHEEDAGMTVALAKNPKRDFCIRRSDSNHPAVSSDNVVAKNKYRESFSLSEHRPFIGVPVFPGPQSQEAVGVIRVVRNSGTRPFTRADEEILKDIASLAGPWFQRWSQHRRIDSVPLCVGYGSRYPFLPDMIDDDNATSVIRSIDRLGAPFELGAVWNSRYITAILQDCVYSLAGGEKRAYMATVRIETPPENETAPSSLALHAMYSTRGRGTARPGASASGVGVPEDLGLQCLRDNKAMSGSVSVEDAKLLSFGVSADDTLVCMPLFFWSDQNMSRGVLSIYFSGEVRLTSDVIQVAFLTSQKLMVMARDNRWFEYTNFGSQRSWSEAVKEFLEVLRRDLHLIDCGIFPSMDGGREFHVVTTSGDSDNELYGMERNPLFNGSFRRAGSGRLVAEYRTEGRKFYVRLPFGYFDTGLELRGLVNFERGGMEPKARWMHSLLSQVVHRWQRFSRTRLGRHGIDSLFQIHFAPEDETLKHVRWKHTIDPVNEMIPSARR